MITVIVEDDAERDAMMVALYVRDFDYQIRQGAQVVVRRGDGAYGEDGPA